MASISKPGGLQPIGLLSELRLRLSDGSFASYLTTIHNVKLGLIAFNDSTQEC